MYGYRKSKVHVAIYLVCLIASILLLVISFYLPPTGVIDPSVLKAVAEIGSFYLIWDFPYTIHALRTFKIAKGDISIEGEVKEKKEVKS